MTSPAVLATPYSNNPSPSSSTSSLIAAPFERAASSPATSIHTTSKHVILPAAAFASERFLATLARGLEPGAGDLVLLAARVGDGALEQALGELEKIENVDGRVWTAPNLRDSMWKEVKADVDGTTFAYLVAEETSFPSTETRAIDHVLRNIEGGDKAVIDDVQLLHILPCAGLRRILALPTPNWTLHLLERPSISFPPLPLPGPKPASLEATLPDLAAAPANPFGVPTLPEWRALWAAWDLVTLAMIPEGMLHDKPIDLRHKCLFYIGHIPTFLNMLLSHCLKEPYTEPKNYTAIFERGIDPHVDDPDHCHSHSEVPEKDEDWPTLNDVLAYRDRVRARLLRLYEDLQTGKRTIGRRLARTLMMTLEHEGFHIETLLYMLIQRAGTGTLPPHGFTAPAWAILTAQWATIPPPTTTSVVVGPATLIMGHDDSEADDLNFTQPADITNHEFGWDNESPARAVQVAAFKAEWRPVTNGEFFRFLNGEGAGKVEMPASWVEVDNEVRVRTLYGPVSLETAASWPVLTSYDDLAIYARSKGGRLPTEPELRLFLDTYDVGHAGGANVGFRNWHPVPATMGCEADSGRGSNGGVWEWTSTLFDTHEGMVPTGLFPGYSTDFFDTKHHVVLGASYATIPRLAGRRTVRNFYQHNYPYPWVGARVVYDN